MCKRRWIIYSNLKETTIPLATVVLGSEMCVPYLVLCQSEVLAWPFQQDLNNGQSTTLPGARHVDRNLVPQLSMQKKETICLIQLWIDIILPREHFHLLSLITVSLSINKTCFLPTLLISTKDHDLHSNLGNSFNNRPLHQIPVYYQIFLSI